MKMPSTIDMLPLAQAFRCTAVSASRSLAQAQGIPPSVAPTPEDTNSGYYETGACPLVTARCPLGQLGVCPVEGVLHHNN